MAPMAAQKRAILFRRSTMAPMTRASSNGMPT